ncbi:MAG: dTMP kinase [Armatimonadetes bacterium]|nr:dTMP kinase [Armatimonadota bacterium]
MSQQPRNASFITLEGPEGSGKSTQMERLRKALEDRGVAVLATREPGGVPVAERIREVVLHEPLAPRAEALLFLAARAQHVEEVIRPALQAGKVVLCDRFHDSTLAYQGYGLGLDLEELRRICLFASDGLQPDLTLLLDVPVKVGLKRRGAWMNQPHLALGLAAAPGRETITRIDNRPIEFHERVRAGFLAEARRDPRRVRILNANRSPEAVHAEVCQLVLEVLGLTSRPRRDAQARGGR